MAIIENAATSPEALASWKAGMHAMTREELIAQQLVQRGAEHALSSLLAVGVTAENCADMLTSMREGLFAIHEVANERGIQLIGYATPSDGETS